MSQPDGSLKAASGRSGNSRRRERCRLERELNSADRERRRLAAQSYDANPPNPADIWVCEFCEYEAIFGERPKILIRDYEIKARRHSQEEADRKRLLEKAKAKSRKARKAGKASARGSQAPQPQTQDHVDALADHSAASMEALSSHSTHSGGVDYGDGSTEEYHDPPPEVPPDIKPSVQNKPPEVNGRPGT